MTFFEIYLDEISYDTPYLQVCTEKKVFENIFFLEKSPVQPLPIAATYPVKVDSELILKQAIEAV